MSETEYDPSGKSYFSLHVNPDILDLLLFLYVFFIFPCIVYGKI